MKRRLAVLKRSADSIVVTTNNKAPASLSIEERCMFKYAHKDALLMETFLENAPLKTMKSFPFHFSNDSQLIINGAIERLKEKNLSEQQMNYIISDGFSASTQQLAGKKCQSIDYDPKQSRAPLRNRNIPLVSSINSFFNTVCFLIISFLIFFFSLRMVFVKRNLILF
ncbi:unnamed protein product [Onchocerca flexuosa]|uniref:Polo_box_3 domain-containing protein n=1 Tax=Onchocerca flexuosa TaxID=387005 RepID=A0A183I823_9BILA|nr:unnamed protein product [Onchocerca flexuosa]